MKPKPKAIPTKNEGTKCSQVEKIVKKAKLYGKGVQGQVRGYTGNHVVKIINLGWYPEIETSSFQPLSYRVDYEVDCMKKLRGTGITPEYYRHWKCFNSKLKPVYDDLDSRGIQLISRKNDEKSGYYTAYIESQVVPNAISLQDFLDTKDGLDLMTFDMIKTLLSKIYIMNIRYDIISTDLDVHNVLVERDSKGFPVDFFIVDFGLAYRYSSATIYSDMVYFTSVLAFEYKFKQVSKAQMIILANEFIKKYPGADNYKNPLDFLKTIDPVFGMESLKGY